MDPHFYDDIHHVQSPALLLLLQNWVGTDHNNQMVQQGNCQADLQVCTGHLVLLLYATFPQEHYQEAHTVNQTAEAYENLEGTAVTVGIHLEDLQLGKEHLQDVHAAHLSSRYLQPDYWVWKLSHRILEHKTSRYMIWKLNITCKGDYYA
jgi:hypothetical protein